VWVSLKEQGMVLLAMNVVNSFIFSKLPHCSKLWWYFVQYRNCNIYIICEKDCFVGLLYST
jgi:hypothetical protein